MTYRDAYQRGRIQLEQQKIAESELDARLLLEYVCKIDRNWFFLHGDELMKKEQEEAYVALLNQRAKHIPLQHITGEQSFMGLSFRVNQDVLIPRQDTEILVEEIMKDRHDGERILDVCTGSGCILISLMKYLNRVEGVGCDISTEALKVAKENADHLGVTPKWVCSDLFEKIEGKFDVIVSNPPYIENDVIETLMEEVRDHEPRLALCGGMDGLDFYRRIVADSVQHLADGGKLFFEIGCSQANAVADLMKNQGFCNVQVVKDYAGLDRVIYGTFK